LTTRTSQASQTPVDRWSLKPVLVTTAPPGRWPRLLRWAAQDAARREVAVVVASALQPGEEAQSAQFASALAVLRKSTPRVQVRAIPTRTDGSDLRALSDAAGLVVISATAPRLPELAMDLDCPLAVVPDREPADNGPVVLGVVPWTAEIVLDSAFREAVMRGVPVEAVRVWSKPADDARPHPTDEPVEAATGRLHRELLLALSFCMDRYPSVDVRPVLLEGDVVLELREYAKRAQLLVLGRSVRDLNLARRTGSPIEGLIRDTRCPVVVIPGDGRRR